VILWSFTVNCGHEHPAKYQNSCNSHDIYTYISLNYTRFPLSFLIIISLLLWVDHEMSAV